MNKPTKKTLEQKIKRDFKVQEISESSDNSSLQNSEILYDKKSGNNKELLRSELENRKDLEANPTKNEYLYPDLDDPNFNSKIALKKEFNDTRYDGDIYSVEDYAKLLANADYELSPHQAFVSNFLSFQTPYNSLLLFHGLGSGKTCASIGVCEEMRDYLKQMGITKRIIVVASPNVQDNFKLQLFDERKLKEVDGIWTMKGCLGNKLLKEINPTGMKGLDRKKVIDLVKNLIRRSYSFQGYVQFSNEIARKAGQGTVEAKKRNLVNEYSDRLIVIDEVHNIRISEENENKNVAKNLMFLAGIVPNMRLLLLSATPMFNSYKEIVWLLNLMNMNDKRGIINVSDVFDKDGHFKKDKDGTEIGKELLIRKATGYVSYVRGENPYTFPFRVYPDRFAPTRTFKSLKDYPTHQINGRRIPDDRKIDKLSLFITPIGEVQELGYRYIVERLRGREQTTKLTRTGKERKVAAFTALKAFGYTDLQIPIEALNIVYPYDGLEDIVNQFPEMEYIDELEQAIDDASPGSGLPEKEVIDEIDDVSREGPSITPTTQANVRGSERESDPNVMEVMVEEGQEKKLENLKELDTNELSHLFEEPQKPRETGTIFEQIERKSTKPSETGTSETGTSKTETSKTETSETKTRETKTSETGFHIVEGPTRSKIPTEKNPVKEGHIFGLTEVPTASQSMSLSKSAKGGSSKKSSSETSNGKLFIDPKELTGAQGLKRIMDYIDTKTPAEKGSYEYRRGVPHVFDTDKIGKYSSKIKNICNSIFNPETKKMSDGIILIYSTYIDAGIIPMALALESMGFTRYGDKVKPLFKTPPTPLIDVRTGKEPDNKRDFKPARYIMITGDGRLSPNNDADVKAITSDDNINGERIKVVLISQAGSEGLDFKAIRQVHILEPWYNINRIEQIIGRAVRNFSHKDLPFDQRNVQIFLYGTMLPNAKEEAADLYIYRISELKAVKIGKVTRLLKQTAVDCIINHDQTKLTSKNFEKLEENRGLKQILSDHQELEDFAVGDMDYSATCDFMKCEFDCLPDVNLAESAMNDDTYSEAFMLVNSDKIIQKIKNLFKQRFFYVKSDLLHYLSTPKAYPYSQIYAALTQIITDQTEYLTDKYGRTGYLVNIGEYYLFQPSELNYKNISIFDRSVPINYKHDMIKFDIKSDIARPVIDKRGVPINILEEGEEIEHVRGKTILDEMFMNYKIATETTTTIKATDNWYQHCSSVIRKMSNEPNIIEGNTEEDRRKVLEDFLIQHIVESLEIQDRIDLMNFLYSAKSYEGSNETESHFISKIRSILKSKEISARGITGMIGFNGPSRKANLKVFVLKDSQWVEGEPEDIRDLQSAMGKYMLQKNKLNNLVGFIGMEHVKKFMVFKLKDTENARSTGFRCDQSGKARVVDILNDIENDVKYTSKGTKDGLFELCVRQEFTLRSFQKRQRDGLIWFVDTETAIINEFEKREK